MKVIVCCQSSHYRWKSWPTELMTGTRARESRANGKTANLRRFCQALQPGFSALLFLALPQTSKPTDWISKHPRGLLAPNFASTHGRDRDLQIAQSRYMQKRAAQTLGRECPISQTIGFP